MNRSFLDRACRMLTAGAAIAMLAGGLSVGLAPRTARADWRTLVGPLPEYTSAFRYAISPNSNYVAFVADIDTDDVYELYSMPLTGTVPLKLNAPLPSGGDVNAYRFAFSLDSQYVYYIADQGSDNRDELYRVPVAGGNLIKLNGTLASGGNVLDFQLDPDGARVVYSADQQTNEVVELWSVPVGGGASVRLNGAFTNGGDVSRFDIDPLSNRVVYTADQETDGKNELFSVPIAGGSAIKLNPPIVLTGGGDSGIYEFEINKIIPVVVFIARTAAATNGNVYMIPTAGGVSPTQLNFNLTTYQRLYSFGISPAGDRVVFNVVTKLPMTSTNAFKGNLYSTLIGGGGNADLTEHADPYYGVDTFQFTPDGSRVIYTFQLNASSRAELQSTTTSSGVRATLYAPGSGDPPAVGSRISNNSQWVSYLVTNGGDGSLYTIPPGGGNPTGFGSGRDMVFSPDSARVFYVRTTDNQGHADLFSAQVFGGDERDLSGTNGTAYVNDVKISADSKSVLFVVQISNRMELRISDGQPAQPPVQPTPTPFYVRMPIVVR